ncbi:hypothetical protein [Planococcus koreensis]|uniref:hypothetical protein n=1 Tax=Planococcus koreensis TaxID=112331 RepID=UPI0039FD9822
MVEWFLGVLYQVVAAIGRFLGWVVLDMAAHKICRSIESYFTNESKLEKNVKLLAEEQWFVELTNDFRYSHIIWHNNRVGRYLRDDSNIRLLRKHEEEQKKFIEMVKQEHKKFAGMPSKDSK